MTIFVLVVYLFVVSATVALNLWPQRRASSPQEGVDAELPTGDPTIPGVVRDGPLGDAATGRDGADAPALIRAGEAGASDGGAADDASARFDPLAERTIWLHHLRAFTTLADES